MESSQSSHLSAMNSVVRMHSSVTALECWTCGGIDLLEILDDARTGVKAIRDEVPTMTEDRADSGTNSKIVAMEKLESAWTLHVHPASISTTTFSRSLSCCSNTPFF